MTIDPAAPAARLTWDQVAAWRARRHHLDERSPRSASSPPPTAAHLCFAPSVGQNVRFTRPDRWLDLGAPVGPGAAALEVTRRFLAANGPATRDDYAPWWGLTGPEAGKLFKALGDEIVPVDVEGTLPRRSGTQPAWLLVEDVEAAVAVAPVRSVRLLPAFDQYVVGATRHAERLLPGPFRDRVYRAQGWLTPVLAVGGRMQGVWRHERKGSRLLVQIEPFVSLPAWAKSGAEEEAERLATFMGGTLDLQIDGDRS